jgi:shikimate kinase
MNIYLIGLPACGKSTCAKEVAKVSKYEYIDLDKEIVSTNNMSIPDMFNRGEDYFRDKETSELERVSKLDNKIISCGGGIVERVINKSFMKGLVIYLEAPLDEIDFRLKRDTSIRPVSNKINIYDLYNLRKDKYDYFKDITIKSQIVSNTVKEILKEANKYEKNFSN